MNGQNGRRCLVKEIREVVAVVVIRIKVSQAQGAIHNHKSTAAYVKMATPPIPDTRRVFDLLGDGDWIISLPVGI